VLGVDIALVALDLVWICLLMSFVVLSNNASVTTRQHSSHLIANIHDVQAPATQTDTTHDTLSREQVLYWLAGLIEFARATAAAGELAPFPYIKSAAGSLLLLLQAVEVGFIHFTNQSAAKVC